MGWFSEDVTTLQQLIAARTQEQTFCDSDGSERKAACLTHTYVAASENSGVLWSVRECRHFQQDEIVERWIVCDLVEFKHDMWLYKSLTESMGPSCYSVPLSYFEMVPCGDAEWREEVIAHLPELTPAELNLEICRLAKKAGGLNALGRTVQSLQQAIRLTHEDENN